jgi:CheY-like chemotaxis protein
MRSSTNVLLQTVNDILDVSKIEAGKFTIEYISTNLKTVFQDVIQVYQPLIEEKNLTFFSSITEDLPANVIIDPLRLTQVLNNLLSNAIKFTDQGSITLEVTIDKASQSKCILNILVKDTGIGISEERASKLFDAFEQEDLSVTRKYGGTGLGLAICQTIITALKGHISFESIKGQGTVFKVTIPLTLGPEKSMVTDSLVTEENKLGSQKKTILLVEDSLVNQKFIATVLNKYGYDYDVANNGLEALEKSMKKNYGLIMMDCQMPIMDGYTSASRIKALDLNKETPIIAMTAYALEGDRLKCMESGMVDYISKPLPIDEIINIVEKYLN